MEPNVPKLQPNAEVDNGEIENVRVVIRVRPFQGVKESGDNQNVALINREENVIALRNLKFPKMQCKEFKFDHIFPEDSSQIDLYQRVALPIVGQLFQGYNGTILAYGQTGSGKTYTMCGNPNQKELRGIMPNMFSHIFTKISKASDEKSFAVTATYIEIYNEEVRDLLSVCPNEKLEIRERVDIGVYIKGLTGFTVDSMEAINELMNIGNSNRTTRATLMNNLSSRSHAIFTITIETKNRETKKTTVAKLNLVDLAGSERLNRSQATGVGLKEASNINQSLFVLSNVISALVEEKSTHIPYRNSKLTRLLQDALGGNSKTAMIATISPYELDYEESLCTLRYASRAKLIKNHVKLNLQMNNGLIEHFEQEILVLQKKLCTLTMNEEAQLKIRQDRSEDGFLRRKQQDDTFVMIEGLKENLNSKITSIQNKILIGGKHMLDKAQEQQFLLESSYEEIENLDKSHQELQELLEEREIEYFDLQEQYSSLQEEDCILDEKIAKLQAVLSDVRDTRHDKLQENTQDLCSLLENSHMLIKELELTNLAIVSAIPKNQLRMIESNVVWNPEICDFQVTGIAHLGNNAKKPKRKFKKHIPKSALMGLLFNERRNSMRAENCILKLRTIKNFYQEYSSNKQK